MNTIYAGPKRGADRAVLLAHGAGSDMHAATLARVADALAAAKIPSLRFNYPYRDAGRKSPDRAAVLDAATREAAGELARLAKVPPEQLVLGGRSMGGRYCSLIVGADDDPVPALGLLLLGFGGLLSKYPHPAEAKYWLYIGHIRTAFVPPAPSAACTSRAGFSSSSSLMRSSRLAVGTCNNFISWICWGESFCNSFCCKLWLKLIIGFVCGKP